MTHRAHKQAPGHYIYRNHHICHETDAEGPEGPRNPYWSVSGEIGGPDEDSGHALLPQLKRLKDCKDWLDAYLEGNVMEWQRIEKEQWRDD